MTALGAVLYGGFFGVAALWLLLTSDGDDAQGIDSETGGADRFDGRARVLSHSGRR